MPESMESMDSMDSIDSMDAMDSLESINFMDSMDSTDSMDAMDIHAFQGLPWISMRSRDFHGSLEGIYVFPWNHHNFGARPLPGLNNMMMRVWIWYHMQ